MVELDTLTRESQNKEQLEADFSRDYSHVSVRSDREENYRFEWLTDQGFYSIAETIDQEYPVKNKVQLYRNEPRWKNIDIYKEVELRKLDSPESYDRLDLVFDDFLVSWEENYSSRRLDEPNLVRLYSSGAGIWPFEHLYGETAEREEEDIDKLLRDIETFFNFN